MLSNSIKLQDSYFYQQFSYVIRTGNNVSTWTDTFNRLVHPAGFIYFGEILILLEGINHFTTIGPVPYTDSFGTTYPADQDVGINPATGLPAPLLGGGFAGWDGERVKSSMHFLQPGLVSDNDLPFTLIIDPVGGTDNTFKRLYYDTVGPVTASLASTWYQMNMDVPPGTPYDTMLKFLDADPMYLYGDMVILDAETGSYAWDDLTVDDCINNSFTWNDVYLAVTLL